MLLKVHHVGYLVPSLDDAVNLYVKTFGAKQSGRGAAGRLGEIAFIQAGEVEVELIQPNDRALLTNGDGHVYHHVGYVVDKLDEAVAENSKPRATSSTARSPMSTSWATA